MKTRSQKLISLVLVLMMLVTLIPMGIFGANAAVSAELSAGLADITNTSEFVINSVEDWEAVAATNNQFLGKTIKLGADIDAEGATLPQLFVSGNVRCTFDGQGYTIRNVGTAETPNPTALFSNKSNLNIQNLTVENCHVAGSGNKGLLVDWQNCWAKYTFQNIKVLNSSVEAEAYAGVLIGYTSGNGGGYGIDFKNIQISGCSATGNAGVGGLVGYTYWNANDYGYTVKGAEVVGCTFTDNTAASQVGGLLGYIRQSTGAVIDVQDCYVDATYVTPNSSGWTGIIAAIYGSTNSSAANNNVILKNIITNGTYAGIVQACGIAYAAQANFTVENVWLAKNPGKTAMLLNGGNTVNGTTGVASNYNGLPYETIVAANIPYMLTKNADGFITSVHAPEGLAYELSQYNSLTTFTINSVEDWNTLAAYSAENSSTTWSGKTIKLGADIIGEVDGSGNPTTVLNQLSPTQFYGTFDGNNKTIKNVKVTNNSLFTNKIDGTTFKNVTFDNLVLTGTGNYSGIFTTIVNDWASSTFSNITVKNTTVTAKAADSGMFCGIVDNKAGTLTFSNITIEDSTLIGATHTGLLFGSLQTQNADTNLVIDGITVNNATVTNAADATIGGLIGWLRANGTETTAMTIQNVDITGIKVSSGECYATGGLIGRVAHTNYNVALDNINIAGSVTTTSTADTDYIGGVIGKVEAAGTVSAQNIYSNMTVTSTTAQKLMIGGFCAYVGVASGKQFVLKDSYIGGAVVANSAHSTSTAGVINKVAGTAGEDIANISNIVVDVDMTGAAGNAVTIFGVHGGNVLLSKCYSVTASNRGTAASGKVRWSFMTHNTSSFINDVENPWTSSDVAGDQFVTIIAKKAAELMVKKDANGYVDNVYTTTISGIQHSNVIGNKYSVRFIAFDFMGDATNVSMNVIATKDGVARSFTANCDLYTGLTAYLAKGITASRAASDYGAQSIAGFTIYNIPADTPIEYTATVTYTTAEGTFSNVMTFSIEVVDGEIVVTK